MAGSDLIAFLVKYVGGEKHCANDIARAFESSKLVIHLADDVNAKDTESTTFKIFLQKEREHQTAVVFSAEEYFSRWCYESKRPPYMIEVFGSDISAALPADTWLFLDPSSPHGMLLPPAFLSKVAAQDFTIGEGAYPIPKSDTGFLFSDFSSSGPGLYNPNGGSDLVVVENKKPAAPPKTPDKNPGKPFMSRSNPTEFFAVPQLAKKEEALRGPRPRSYTSSNLGKIIRPPNSDKDKS